MRDVTSAGSYKLRTHVLPWMLAAMLLRAFIPPGFMPGASDTIAATMCSTVGSATQESIQQIEIPGSVPVPHCDFCLWPATGPAPAEPRSALWLERRVDAPHGLVTDPVDYSLLRAQSARGPPFA
jgi:hypothetical protein